MASHNIEYEVLDRLVVNRHSRFPCAAYRAQLAALSTGTVVPQEELATHLKCQSKDCVFKVTPQLGEQERQHLKLLLERTVELVSEMRTIVDKATPDEWNGTMPISRDLGKGKGKKHQYAGAEPRGGAAPQLVIDYTGGETPNGIPIPREYFDFTHLDDDADEPPRKIRRTMAVAAGLLA